MAIIFSGFGWTENMNVNPRTTFYRAKCKTDGFISNWHYNRGNAEIAKKHHEQKWSTRGETDPRHYVTIHEKNE